MKLFKSIQWRLQLWYGLILAGTVAAGIATSYQMERDRLFAGADKSLHVQFQNLMNVVHLPPLRNPPHSPPELRPPEERLPEPHFPKEAVASFFQNTAAAGYYYVIWLPDGTELMRSSNAPTDLMVANNSWNPAPQMPRGESRRGDVLQKHGDNYELVVSIRGERQDYDVLIGHSLLSELQELRRYLLKQIVNGLIILFAGLFVGHALISHSLRPIGQISSTAVKISAGDLTQRINVAETESELGRLAAVLNSTFARLEAAFDQQRQFASDAAHELRTPVSVMLTQTQTALNRDRTTDEYRQTVEACLRSAQRMRRLIEALLELTRLDAGQEPMKRVSFDLSQMIRDCVGSVHPLADQRGMKMSCELSSVNYSGDPDRLGQVVTNLLANAIQYNQSGGAVRVKLESQSGLAILEVADTGPGISEVDLPRVFERFYRGDKSRSDSNGHAGLGLAISKAIIEAHGGTIEAASRVGEGATFTVRLPLM